MKPLWICSISILLAAALLAGQEASQPSQQKDSCFKCHLELAGTPLGDPAEQFEPDVHREVGLSCADCHGGDPSAEDVEVAMSLQRGYLGAPEFKDIPEFCGRCHASAEFMRHYDPSLRIDQLAEYRSSNHGQRLAQGDTQVAVCTSCHSVHGIRRASDPLSPVYPAQVADTCGQCHSDEERMKPYGLATDQETLYQASAHGIAMNDKRDISAATCNDCHGNHGAAPPGVSSVANVCGNCHGTQRNLFQQSAHGELFASLELSACITCHNNHSIAAADEGLLAGSEGACANCHEDDAGMEAAQQFASAIGGLTAQIEGAREILHRAERAGMEVSGPLFDLHEAGNQVVLARNEVHLLDLEKIQLTIAEGAKVAQASHQKGMDAFEQLDFRRQGLYVALLIIGLVVAGLALWIRELERKPGE